MANDDEQRRNDGIVRAVPTAVVAVVLVGTTDPVAPEIAGLRARVTSSGVRVTVGLAAAIVRPAARAVGPSATATVRSVTVDGAPRGAATVMRRVRPVGTGPVAPTAPIDRAGMVTVRSVAG